MRQLVLAFGAAMLLGNLAVIVRERFRRDDTDRPKPNKLVVSGGIVVGALMTLWGAASLLVA
jgi:hypothetical protein